MEQTIKISECKYYYDEPNLLLKLLIEYGYFDMAIQVAHEFDLQIIMDDEEGVILYKYPDIEIEVDSIKVASDNYATFKVNDKVLLSEFQFKINRCDCMMYAVSTIF